MGQRVVGHRVVSRYGTSTSTPVPLTVFGTSQFQFGRHSWKVQICGDNFRNFCAVEKGLVKVVLNPRSTSTLRRLKYLCNIRGVVLYDVTAFVQFFSYKMWFSEDTLVLKFISRPPTRD